VSRSRFWEPSASDNALFTGVRGIEILRSCVSFCNPTYFALLGSAAGPTGHALSSKEVG
jgi:hypothetical protein